jgi:hypothetical protein
MTIHTTALYFYMMLVFNMMRVFADYSDGIKKHRNCVEGGGVGLFWRKPFRNSGLCVIRGAFLWVLLWGRSPACFFLSISIVRQGKEFICKAASQRKLSGDFAPTLRDGDLVADSDPGFRCASPWAIFMFSLRENLR